MRRFLPSVAGVALALAFCADAQAQRHMRSAGLTVVSAPAGTQVIRSNGALRPASSSLVGTTAFVPTALDSAQVLVNGSFPVPGLGFDFTHYAAVNRNLGVRALIDPITQQQLELARQIRRETPVLPAGMPLLINSIQIVIVPQPPVIILQQPAAQEEPEERVEHVRYVEDHAAPASRLREEGGTSAEAASPPPHREASDLIFIRRDGGLVFAVAFITRGEHIIYVTPEGLRRSLPLAALDVEATLQMNELRGTTLKL